MRSRYSLLWIDLTVSVHDSETLEAFESFFRVHRVSALASIDSEIARLKPDALCFDYDYPTKQSLQALQETKSKHRSLPILMLTVQHSESLAVWAFRSRVWDYLVKPLSKSDVDRCLTCFAEMMSYRDQSRRRAAMPVSTIPLENRVSARASQEPLGLSRALQYVERNYRGKISSAKAAALCGLTTFQFSRLFKEAYGLTFQEYVIRFRLREAGRLLKNPNAQVAEVAYLVGFNDPSYFTKVFRRYTGISPSQFAAVSSDAELDPERLLEVLNGD
ncbi:MAG TPA: response regulator transcription factor [Gammaproteobacteria bacterium]